MRFSSGLTLASVATLATALPAAQAPAASGACPAVWTQISQALTKIFKDGSGQCTDLARAAVRVTWHDCGTWSSAQGLSGGCDGSIILSAEENARPANQGLQQASQVLKALADQYQVGVADMIAFAGAHATVSCPLGPTVKTLIGRKDSSNAAPDENLLPHNASLSSTEILSLMSDKGFNAGDTAALVGAHSCSKQFFVDPSLAGEPQDSTPGIWDVAFYSQTLNPPKGVFVFHSDISLAQDPASAPAFKQFQDQATWNGAFADTFNRLSLLGVNQEGMVDCTSALPAPVDSFPGANPSTTGTGNSNSPSATAGQGSAQASTGFHQRKRDIYARYHH